MNFLFFNAADQPLFSRDDAEQAEHNHQEMSLTLLFPYDPGKVIERGMRIGYTDALGVFQAFEIRKDKTYEPDHYQEITAEHIAISELTDEFFAAAEWTNITAQAALTALLSGTLWSVGNVSASGTSSANISNGNVWQDVRAIESAWNVYILPRITVSASGITGRYLDIIPASGTWRGLRLSLEKNLQDASVIWDDTNVKTALYGFGKSVETSGTSAPLTFASVTWSATSSHPAKPSGQTYIEDPAATAAYGRNGRARFGFYQNADISDATTLLQKTWETLKTVSIPEITIDGTVTDLHRLGAPDVPIRLHDTALVEIRPTGVILAQEVIQYTEDLLNLSASRLTIGAYIPNIVYIERQTNQSARGRRGSGRSQSDKEYELSEFDTEITANKYQISLRAYQRDLNNTDQVLKDAGIGIESGGVMIYALDNTKGVGAQLKTNADSITAEVTRAKGKENQLSASIEINAEAITSKVSKGAVASTINQTAQSVLIQASKIDLDGYVTASQLSATNATISNLMSGESTATRLVCGSFRITSGYAFQYGSSTISKSTLNIGGTDYHVLTWSG